MLPFYMEGGWALGIDLHRGKFWVHIHCTFVKKKILTHDLELEPLGNQIPRACSIKYAT
jgi:hypothetical protein